MIGIERFMPFYNDLLCCPACRAPLTEGKEGFFCSGCVTVYYFSGSRPCFLSAAAKRSLEMSLTQNKENALKNFFKRFPKLYRFLVWLVAPVLFTGLPVKQFIRQYATAESRILNAGSGPTFLGPQVLNVDVFPFHYVHILADAAYLPFCDGAFDLVCSEQVLEHIPDPYNAVSELMRVTKTGGYVYVAVPFVYPWHPSPGDYSRWSREGLEALFNGYESIASGVLLGPTSSFLVVTAAWLSHLFSFGWTPLRSGLNIFFQMVLGPLRIFDVILSRLPGAEIIAAGVYFVGRKR